MAKSSGIVDYILERFADLEDPAAVKKALLSVLAILMDEGKIDFVQSESKAGYVDDMRLTNGGTIADVDKAIRAIRREKPTREERPAAKVPTLRGQYAQGLREPTDIVTKRVFEDLPYDTMVIIQAIAQGQAKDGRARDVAVMLERNAAKLDEVMQGLNEIDRQIFVAVCNIVLNCKEGETPRATPTQIYRIANRNPNAKPHEAQLARLDDSIAKMAGIYIRLDVAQIFDIYPDLPWMQVQGNLIDVTKWAARNAPGGDVYEYYEFKESLPVLFQYALAVGQMKTISPHKPNALDMGISNTRDNQAIVRIIADRVDALEGMRKNGKTPYKNMYKVNFQSFFDRVSFETCKNADSVRKKRSRVKNAVKKQLDYLTRRGVIGGWNELEDGVEIYPGEVA